MCYNYDFYAGGICYEDETNAVYNILRRMASNNRRSMKMGALGRAWTWLKSAGTGGVSAEMLNKHKKLLQEIQRLNLVGRKRGSDVMNSENRLRMRALIDLMCEKKQILIQFASDPGGIETSMLPTGQARDLCDVFRQLFQTSKGTLVDAESSALNAVRARQDQAKMAAEALAKELEPRRAAVEAKVEDALVPFRELLRSAADWKDKRAAISLSEAICIGFGSEKSGSKVASRASLFTKRGGGGLALSVELCDTPDGDVRFQWHYPDVAGSSPCVVTRDQAYTYLVNFIADNYREN